VWTLENALPIIRKLAPIAEEHGFSVALYGGVLASGQSANDLDLFFVLQKDECDVDGCLQKIRQLPEVTRIGAPVNLFGGPVVFIWLQNGDHIDAQFRGIP
jgi:hypothetical protein